MGRILVIAEAGVNHNGRLDYALKMVDKAKEAGADIVKFQTSIPENVVSKFAEKAEYQKKTTGSDENQQDMIRKITLKFEDYKELKHHCEEKGIKFLSTPFDIDSVRFLEELGCDMWKIPSGEVTNLPYLIEIAKTHKPIILSTGMCTMEEVTKTIETLKEHGAGEISLLHCTTEYPTPYNEVNLKAMLTLKGKFGLRVGYSDHTPGIEIPIAAVAMGAEIIEKHFTLDNNLEGPDHKASLEPDGLTAMVKGIRHVEEAMGDGNKIPTRSEIGNMAVMRKSIVAQRDIKKGEEYTTENITTKRPGNGISAMKWFDVLGKTANRDYKADELIE